MSCSNYVAKTFAHAGGMLALAAAGTQVSVFDTVSAKASASGLVGTVLLIIGFVGTFILFMMMSPGPVKYIAAVPLFMFLGAIMRDRMAELKMKDTLDQVLGYTIAITVGMVALAMFDTRGRFLQLWPVLFVGLFATLVATLYYAFKDQKRPETLSMVIAGLFSLFLGFDTQMIRAKAKICVAPADYINSAIGLTLDVLNIFSALSDVVD